MSSTMETSKYNRNTFSSRKLISCKRIIFHEKKKGINNSPIQEIQQNEPFISRNNNLFFKKRNNSSNNILNNNIISEFNSINKRMKVNGINRIGISLKQVSNLPFEKLAKLSIRYMKTEK